jgi:hypothetical protein
MAIKFKYIVSNYHHYITILILTWCRYKQISQENIL